MLNHKVNRRDLLRLGIGTAAGGALVEGLGHLARDPRAFRWFDGSYLPYPDWSVADAFKVTRAMGLNNSPLQAAALLQLQEAYAQSSSNDWSLITIKVFDQVHPPLVFALGDQDASGQVKSATNITNTDHPALKMLSDATRTHLLGQNIKSISQNSRFAKLRLNEWFGSRLYSGTYDGASTATSANTFSYQNYVGPFPSNVAIQAALCLGEVANIPVHRLLHGKIREDLSDLNHYAGLNLIKSPLGISAFMMGGQYDSNGSLLFNVVYKAFQKDSEDFDVKGRSLSEIVQNIDQSLQQGFGDDRNVDAAGMEANLTRIFDKLVVKEPKMRTAILDSRAAVKRTIEQMKSLGGIENQPLRALSTSEANFQADLVFTNAAKTQGSYQNTAAQQEFLSHCAFVADALKIEGQPYRNFSLFLNLNDLDGLNMDDPKNPSFSFQARALNYIEGMRQLAMGLNILANAIKGKKALVVVISDGARNAAMGDGGQGNAFGFVMGPNEGTGMLDDALHGPSQIFNIDTSVAANVTKLQGFGALANTNEALGWTTGDSSWGLCNSSGQRIMNTRANTGDWQIGVLQFIAEAQGVNMRSIPGSSSLVTLGNYVRLKRKAA